MYYQKEQKWNIYSHALGIILGIVALILLVVYDTNKTSYSRFSLIIYGVSIIVLYTASTMYHAISYPEWKPLLRKIDHICIYFLIAGTYTPVALISMEQSSGWTLFWIVWAVAAFGTLLKVFYTGKFEAISLVLYLAMGWLIAIDLNGLIAAHSRLGLTLLVLGGAFYTLGIIFYAVKRIPYNHAIWHFFVLAGSIFHFFFIFCDVI